MNSNLSEWSEPPLPPALSLTAVVMRADGFLEAEIDDEIVALSIERGSCYGFNRVGSRIWTLLASPVRIRDLIATLLDPDVCERQVLDLLGQPRAEGLTVTTKKT